MATESVNSGEAAVQFREKLQAFGQLAAGGMDELMTLAMAGAVAAQDAAAASGILERYGELVQHIGQLAWDSGLAGLQAVCSLVETNVLLLRGETRPLTGDECALLEGWPMILFAYMANHADRESSTALLQSLSATWPMTLPADAVAQELDRLMGVQQTSASPAPDSASATLLDGEPQQVEREVLAILASELEQMAAEFVTEGADAGRGTPSGRQQALDHYCDFLGRLKLAAESVGLSTLGAIFAALRQQIAPLTEGLSAKQQALLRQLRACLADYLIAPADEDVCAALVGLLADAAWPLPLANDAALAWQRALASVEVRETAVQTLARPLRAVGEDVSLDLSGDVAAELVDGLLQELPVQVAAFSAAISRIGGGAGTLKDAEQAMRAAHTLKGAANTVGVSGIANLTHHLEDILVALIDAEKMPQRPLADALINAADCLEAMSEFLLALGPAPEHAVEVLQEVLDYANRLDREGVAALATDVAAPSPTASMEMREPRLAGERGAEQSPPAPEHSLRVPAPVVDELLRLAGETLISNSQIQEHLKQAIDQASVIRSQHQLLQQLVAELEDLVDIRGIRSPRADAVRNGTGFDALEFEHYSELQTISRRLIEAATDAQEMAGAAEEQLSTLDELLEEQRRLQVANQHAVMRTRMVTVSSVASRLQRGVRQTGRLLDKAVELSIQGENTSIDSHVLNDLMDPLMHLLRNAVDHGIEAAPERVAAGKPPQGRINLSFSREGNMIVVRCTDDGAGLDYSAIRRIAERKGMLRPEHDHNEEELARLILAPGFSTRDETSQVSGRGVGMDIVYSRVQEMKGMLALNSRRGRGLTVELRLPATLLAAHTLIVRQRERRLAISSRGVEDIRYATHEQIVRIGDRQFFRDGERMHSLFKLEELLSMAPDRRAHDRDGFPVLLTRPHDGSVSAVLVQEILDSREVVMKKFGRYVPRTQGVIGAVILGDGGMAPVIDLVDLLQAPPQRQAALREEQVSSERSVQRAMRRALVVDDSLSARRAMAQVMRDAGYEVRTANDGLDAVNILAKFVPDIILSDMEMPRMNGLELAANVRHAEHTKHVPVIMITSRSTEKHRHMSAAAGVDVHLVKPFSEEALLQHVSRLTAR